MRGRMRLDPKGELLKGAAARRRGSAGDGGLWRSGVPHVEHEAAGQAVNRFVLDDRGLEDRAVVSIAIGEQVLEIARGKGRRHRRDHQHEQKKRRETVERPMTGLSHRSPNCTRFG